MLYGNKVKDDLRCSCRELDRHFYVNKRDFTLSQRFVVVVYQPF